MKLRPHRDWFYVDIAKLLIALSQSFQFAKPRNGQVRVRQSAVEKERRLRHADKKIAVSTSAIFIWIGGQFTSRKMRV